VNDPLLHLVRNAVDHGLERPAERVAAGKAPQGFVEVSAEAAGGEVRVVVSDDGRGMDPRRLRERAVRLGLLDAAAAALMSDSEALELIFTPGFSTAETVTEISGRGVGMDVARSNIAELGGQVRVESQLGAGTRIVLTLPLTLVTTRVLLVRSGGGNFALPASSCQGTTWVRRAELRSLEGQPTIVREGRTMAVVALSDLLGLESPWPLTAAERAPAVVAGSAKRPIALLLDALLDEREAVVKPLGTILARQRSYGGAVQLGDGSLVLLLNPLLLNQGGRLASAPAAPTRSPRGRRRLLVVDDSFTTRELIRSILQSAGYEVAAAVDGADGLEKLRGAAADLVVSDVEMPRLDGFQLAAAIRDGQAGREVPVVLITSLASDEHRRRGLEAGASAYIVKSQFNQESLLDVVRQLLGER
jgi:two-component system chemotaxis sensor kinase CheA